MVEIIEDSDGVMAELDQSLLASLDANPHSVAAFNAHLRQAIDMTYLGKVKQAERSVGIDWMRRTHKSPFAFAHLLRVLEKPVEMFLEHNEYNRAMSDIVCSCLFEHFIPQSQRDEFTIATVGRWGPRDGGWIRFAEQGRGNVSRSVLAQLVLQFVRQDMAFMTRLSYIQYMIRPRSPQEWLSDRNWSVLDIAQHREAAIHCFACFAKLPKQNGKVTFRAHLETLFGTEETERIIAESRDVRAGEQISPKLDAEASSGILGSVLRTKSLEQLIDEALKTGEPQLIKHLLPLYAEREGFILDYQTKYHHLLSKTKTPVAQALKRCFIDVLAAKGWQVGKATLQEWKGELRPEVLVTYETGAVTYVQRFGSYYPQEGEEVMFRPSASKGIAPDLYAVSFIQLHL